MLKTYATVFYYGKTNLMAIFFSTQKRDNNVVASLTFLFFNVVSSSTVV